MYCIPHSVFHLTLKLFVGLHFERMSNYSLVPIASHQIIETDLESVVLLCITFDISYIRKNKSEQITFSFISLGWYIQCVWCPCKISFHTAKTTTSSNRFSGMVNLTMLYYTCFYSRYHTAGLTDIEKGHISLHFISMTSNIQLLIPPTIHLL